jgi:hypothetical protein
MRESLAQIMEGVAHDKAKFVANNTVEYFINGERRIRLHHTDILIFQDKFIRLSSGGWKTNTTKDRLNHFLPISFKVYSEEGFWYVSPDNSGRKIAFSDGMIINRETGKVQDAPDYDVALSEFRQGKKATAKYIKNYIDLLCSGKMSLPSAGDCLICRFMRQNNSRKDGEHILSHIQENYLVPSLIHIAVSVYDAPFYYSVIVQLQKGDTSIAPKGELRRILRKYINSQIS